MNKKRREELIKKWKDVKCPMVITDDTIKENFAIILESKEKIKYK